MLTSFFGTGGNDALSIFVTGSTTHVVINGADNATSDLNITINASGGNDVVSVAGTRSSSNVTVLGGSATTCSRTPSLIWNIGRLA